MRPDAVPLPARKSLLLYAALVAVAVTVPVALGAATRGPTLAPPVGLDTFQLRVGPAAKGIGTFWRTPSFKWQPVRGAGGYRFELATSPDFRAGSNVIWSARTSGTPAVTLPIGLPWVNGSPLYWHVRVIAGNGQSAWSRPAAFRIQPDNVPRKVAEGPGYVRWSAVRGATGYDVWFVTTNKVISTTTTMADFRGFYGKGAAAKVAWRVRASRRLYGPAQAGLLPSVSYGKWSETYTSRPSLDSSASLSTVFTGSRADQAGRGHESMPAFLFAAKDAAELHHVYVATDASCKNIVFNSAIVRGSAFVPRSIQFGRQSRVRTVPNDGPVFTKGGQRLRSSEASPLSAPNEWARIDLSDGRYYWTVVPVERHANGSYHDLESPQDACRSGMGTFSKKSAGPALATQRGPYATGLSPAGRLLSAAAAGARFYGFPLVTWRPVPGATQYEVQWSSSSDPWRVAGKLKTYSTSSLVPLAPGTWWYRVRGLNAWISGKQALAWSAPARVRITAPTFSIARS
jgi:hypothetical protein